MENLIAIIISLIFSGIAVTISILSYRRADRTNKPIIVNLAVYTTGKINFDLADYSASGNLRVDKIKIKPYRILFKHCISVLYSEGTVRRRPDSPPMILFVISKIPEPIHKPFKIKIYTNYGNIVYKLSGASTPENQ